MGRQALMPEPFVDSRRLTGCNLYFHATGAALESAPGLAFDDAALVRWADNIAAAREALAWPAGEVHVRRHRSGASLAFAAPFDQLYAATEVAGWALSDALGLQATDHVVDEDGASRPRTTRAPGLEALRHVQAHAARHVLPA